MSTTTSEAWRIRKRDLARAKAREVLEETITDRPHVSDVDCAWAAGCFEGEGTATITRANGHTRGVVTLTNTDLAIVEFFQKRWPGVFRAVASKNPRHKDRFVWCLNSNLSILCFIADVAPFAITGRMVDRLALLESTQRIRIRGSRDPELRARLESAREEMALLNRKGRAA